MRTRHFRVRLIDDDTGKTVATADSLLGLLPETDLLPGDVADGAESWAAVVDVADRHADGINGLLDGWTVSTVAGWES